MDIDQQKKDILGQLDTVIDETVSHIHDFTKSDRDFTRNRKLDAKTLIKVTLNMQGNSLNAELLDAFPDINDRMTASAYEQAKGKLSSDCYKYIFDEFNKTMTEPKLFNDKYRVFAIDGSDFNVPYNPNSQFVVQGSIGRPKKDGTDAKPYSIVHANMLYDIINRTYQDCIFQTRGAYDERGAAINMLKQTPSNHPFIAIMDRGYDGLNMIENCNRIENCYYVIRMRASGNNSGGGMKILGGLPDKELDMEIEINVTTSRTFFNKWKDSIPNLVHINRPQRHYKPVLSKNTTAYVRWDFENRCKVKFRVCKFRINDPSSGKDEWKILVTNLNRFEFPITKMKELYHMRWDIETSFRELKYALGGVKFHSKKDDFILMELYSHFIMFNAVSRAIAMVKVPQTNHKYPYAIDFKMACLIVRKYYQLHNDYPPDDMLVEILAYTNPVREGRQDKRNMKSKTAIWFVYRVA